MLIKALTEYYDILQTRGEVLKQGYSKVAVKYIISLTENGEIDSISDCRTEIPIQDKKGKIKTKLVPKEEVFPQRTQKPAIDLNVAEHRPTYIFGLVYDSKSLAFKEDDKSKKSHEVFVNGNLSFIEDLNSPVVNAFRNFLLNFKSENELSNPHLLAISKEIGSSGFAFSLSGRPDLLLNNDPALSAKWDIFFSSKQDESESEKAQCCISGNSDEIARIHDKIKGILGSSAFGSTLICFNNSSEYSYGKEKSFNSNVSVSAMKKYTTALNMLLENPNHRTYLEDMTIVYFALTNQPQDNYINLFNYCSGNKLNDDELNVTLKQAFTELKNGRSLGSLELDLDENVDFYIIGLTPNSSRVSVKFLYKNKIAKIINNAVLHQQDMAIGNTDKQISMWQLLKELVSPKSKNEKVPSPLIANLYESIMFGKDYPTQLLSTVIRRVKTDSNTEKEQHIKLNQTRAGIIKACLNRKSRQLNLKEEITLALDQTNKNSAYLCGRLFAILEKIQQEASGNNLNRTIKDAYFASACASPAVIFPKLVKLAQNHLPKVRDFWNWRVGEIINLLENEFPKTLSLNEQGKFILGYYQQFYFKKENQEDLNNGSN